MSEEAITHMVLVRPLTGVSPADFAAAEAAFLAMPAAIDGLEEVRCGANVSTEKLGRGFTWAAVMRLRNAAARDAYLPHQAHGAAAEKLKPLAADVLVFDLEGAW